MKNKIFKYIGYVITLIAFTFLIKTMLSMKLDVKYIKNPILAVICGIVLSIGYIFVVYISAYAWKSTLEFVKKDKISFKEIIKVYAKSNIGKYLPGNVMQFASRNIFAGRLGFKQFDITFCSVLEILMLVITDCILSIVFDFNSFKGILKDALKKVHPTTITFIIFIFVIVIVISLFLFILTNKKISLAEYKHIFTFNFLRLLIKLFCIYSITLIMPGIFLLVIFKAVLGVNLSFQTGMLIISGYTISWVLGFVVPGAPGGVGVRESIMILILANAFNSNIVLLAAILLRISSTLGDVLAFLFSAHTFVNKT